jgi:glycosyltransferase involved in cell wall biosynthesis
MKKEKQVDLVLIGSTNDRLLIPLAKMCTRAPVVFDMLYAMHDNWIEERKLVSKYHPKAWGYSLIDWLACVLSDAIVVENFAHADFFAKRFHVSREKFIRVFVGTDDELMKPLPREEKGTFEVEFHGKFFPMQGTHMIVRAMKELIDEKDIHLTMIGGGQLYASTQQLANQLELTNVTFIPAVPFSELPQYIKNAHATLGLLGDFPRTDRSMPNKLFETAAMERLCINADVPAVKELFTDGVDVCLVKKGDPHALAEKIRYLKQHPHERKKIEEGAYQTYLRAATPQKVGEQLIKDIRVHFPKITE